MEEIIPVAAEWSAILSTQRHDVSMKRHAFVRKSHVSSRKIEEGYVFGVNSWVSLNKGYWIYLKYFLWQLRVTNGGGPRARPHQCKQTLYTSNSDPILVISDLIFWPCHFWMFYFLYLYLGWVRDLHMREKYLKTFCVLRCTVSVLWDPLIYRRFSREKKLLRGLNDKIFIQDFVIFRGRDRISIIF